MSKIDTAISLYKIDGIRGIVRIIREKVGKAFGKSHKLDIKFLVDKQDVMKCDFDIAPKTFDTSSKKGPFVFNWVVHPPGRGSGGHQNMFRFIKFLEKAGHKCRIYLYSAHEKPTIERVRNNISVGYDQLDATIEWLDGEMEPADGIFATGWETAYPVYNQASNARRFYFVQDFEPFFYTVGTEHKLAENTYSFGFTGITAGRWLTSKLRDEYDMKCDFYDFGVDNSAYKMTNFENRKKVFFYARPVTPRRGFELGLMVLEKFHKKNPDVEIIMAGWDVSNYEIDFPYTDLGVSDVAALPEIYNSCAAALVLSFSNLSLLPLELLSCGVIPVLNRGPNNEMVADNVYIKYCESAPGSLAKALDEAVNRPDQVEYAKKASESVSAHDWKESGERFVSIIEGEMSG